MKNIEIEFKALLSKQEFDQLTKHFKNGNSFTQTNHYFDTEDFILKQHNMALRIREKQTSTKITLKHKKIEDDKEYIIEISDLINNQQKDEILSSKIFKSETILKYLQDQNIFETTFNKYICFNTNRTVYHFDNYTIFLDMTMFDNFTDYEFEIEVNDYVEGKKIFEEYVSKFNLEQNNKTKIERAYNYKNEAI